MKAILLVEDNEDIREMFAEILRQSGYEVHEAENGAVALHKLGQMHERPCLLVLDLMMPVMDGFTLLQELEKSGQLATLPVIVASAGAASVDMPGVVFVRKPINAELLVQLVDEACAAGPK